MPPQMLYFQQNACWEFLKRLLTSGRSSGFSEGGQVFTAITRSSLWPLVTVQLNAVGNVERRDPTPATCLWGRQKANKKHALLQSANIPRLVGAKAD